MDLVRRGAGGQCLRERRGDAAGEVVDRSEWPRDRKVVAGAEQHACAGLEIGDEPRDEGGLADPGLTRDDDDAAVAPRCCSARLRELSQCPFTFEELHTHNDRPAGAFVQTSFGYGCLAR